MSSQGMTKNTVNATAKCHPKERQIPKDMIVCPHPPRSLHLAPHDCWLFPKVKETLKGECFGSVQDMEASMTVQLKILRKEESRAAAGNCKDDRINVSSGRGRLSGGFMALCLLL